MGLTLDGVKYPDVYALPVILLLLAVVSFMGVQ